MTELVNLIEVKAKKDALNRLAALAYKRFNPKNLTQDEILEFLNDSDKVIASLKQKMFLSDVLFVVQFDLKGRQIIASNTRDISEIFDEAGLPETAENMDNHLKNERKKFQDLVKDEQEILGIAKTLGISVENDRRLDEAAPGARPN